MKCTATSKRTGRPCGANAVTGREVCYHHGGRSPAGVASPRFQTGRYSKHLPDRLLPRYHEAQDDPRLLDLEAEIALVDARLADVLTRVDTGESGSLWKQAQAAWRDSTSADVGVALAAKATLTQLFEAGVADYAAWDAVASLIQQRKALVESERKRLVEMQQMVRVDQALVLVNALVESVRRHVSDPLALAGISADFARLLGRADPVVIDRAPG